jgi:hypothetical protein
MDDELDKEAIGRELAGASPRRGNCARRGPADPEAADYPLLKQWQADRLARTYADLLASERYAPAAEFFLSDLYGPKDFRSRDEELARVVPVMVRVLPARALLTLLEAVKMDTLSESLDTDMVWPCAPPGAATTSTGMPTSRPTAPAAAAPTANSRSRWWTRSARRWTA